MIKQIIQNNQSVTPDSRINETLHRDFPQCFDKNGNFDLQKFKDILPQENSDASPAISTTREGYGLQFLGRNYANLIAATDTETVVVPDIAHNSLPENADSGNIYISGDNLDALKHLLKSYSRSVKCIYIDPPYNTGNDGFVYRDNFNFTTQELENRLGVDSDKAQRILDLTSRRSSSHSAWLTFMASRLFLARDLLTDDGVIFISIDDNEQANLKLLCDSIFGEENFVANLIWERAYAPKNDAKLVSNSHDYVLMYTRNLEQFTIGRLERTEAANSRYSNPDNDPRGVWQSDNLSVKTYTASCDYPITTPSGRVVEPPTGRCWSLSKKIFFERLKDNRIWFGADGNGVPRIKRFLSELKNEGMAPTSILFYKNVGHSQEGAQEVKDLLNNQGVFDGPKPIRLLKHLLVLANLKDDSIVVDFFSGSASTAHAVLEHNVRYRSKNKFIMVQIAEETPEGSPARNAGYTTIDQIGMERIKRAAKKIREENPLFAGKMDLGFKHFTLQGVETNTLDRLTAFAPEPMLTDDDILKTFGKETVLATWLVNDNYGFTAKPSVLPLAQYIAYTIGTHIYLLEGQNFDEDSVVALVNKYFNEPAFNPTEIVAFGYSFNYAQIEMLRKNIKMLQQGKKNLQVELHIRY